jgi:hypothetical protein
MDMAMLPRDPIPAAGWSGGRVDACGVSGYQYGLSW